jgi:hypothetical protein
MRPEERQAAECQERAFDEAVRGEEQERQKELERLGLSHLQGKLFRILTELAELTWREVVAMLYSVKWDTLGPIQRRRYRGKLRALLFRLNRQLEAEGRKRRGLPVDDSRRRRPLPPRPAGAKTRVQREREALLSCTSAIRGALAGGPLPAWRLKQLCRERGYKPGTVKKARKRLGVTAIREGFGESMLYLPPD